MRTGENQSQREFEIGLSYAVHLHSEVGVVREECAQPRGSLATALSGLLKIAVHPLLHVSQQFRVSAILFGLLTLLCRRPARRER